MKEYLASPRPTKLQRARRREVLESAPAPARPRHATDSSEALVSELRAVRGEVASLRETLPPNATDEILTRKQAAVLLGMCIESVTKLVRDEGLPCRRVGKEYRFLRSQVLAWLASRDEARLSGRRLQNENGVVLDKQAMLSELRELRRIARDLSQRCDRLIEKVEGPDESLAEDEVTRTIARVRRKRRTAGRGS